MMSRLISVIGLALLLAGCAYYGPGYGYGYYGPGYYSYGSGYGAGYPGVNGTEQTASPAATYGG
jgi:hypothetical protein